MNSFQAAVVAGFVLLAAVGCDESGNPAADHDHHAMHVVEADTLVDEEGRSGHSVFHLDSTWTTSTGEELKLEALGARTSVVAMVYTSCEVACPRIIAGMRAIKATANRSSEELGFVLVSIDPERDTPGRMSDFAKRSQLDEADWTLLRSDDDSVRELAAVLGVRYRRIDDMDFAHSNIITVLNRRGEIVHQQIGLDGSADESATAIQVAVESS